MLRAWTIPSRNSSKLIVKLLYYFFAKHQIVRIKQNNVQIEMFCFNFNTSKYSNWFSLKFMKYSYEKYSAINDIQLLSWITNN